MGSLRSKCLTTTSIHHRLNIEPSFDTHDMIPRDPARLILWNVEVSTIETVIDGVLGDLLRMRECG